MKRILMVAGLGLAGYALWKMYGRKGAAPTSNQGTFSAGVDGTSGGGAMALGLNTSGVSSPVLAADSSPSPVGASSSPVSPGVKMAVTDPIRETSSFSAFF